GSSCIYPRLAPQPMVEGRLLSGPLEPTNQWYAVAKIAGIKMGQALRRQHGFRAISAMPTNLYGPGDNFDLMGSHVLPALIRKVHLARMAAGGDWEGVEADRARFGDIPRDFRATLGAIAREAGEGFPEDFAPERDTPAAVVFWGTGQPRREFLHVDDLASACVFLMERYDEEEIVNVGVGEDVSIRELAEKVQETSGFAGETVWDHEKPDGAPRKLLDVTRLKALGWEPSISLDEGVSRTSAWYRDQVEAQREAS
ncbi:MAG: NAD-dependent epimerase/dehydratase family protein, partial [Pseudomonadota bacterium]